MKSLPWILVALLVIALATVYFRPIEPRPAEIVRDTTIQIDTIRDTVPVPSKVRPVRTDTVYLPVGNDSIKGDSVSVVIPITQKEYETEKYKAWVSGYRAKLDSIDVYDRTRTITEREMPKRKRFGLGLQVGYGMAGNKASPYVGIGVSYDLFRW